MPNTKQPAPTCVNDTNLATSTCERCGNYLCGGCVREGVCEGCIEKASVPPTGLSYLGTVYAALFAGLDRILDTIVDSVLLHLVGEEWLQYATKSVGYMTGGLRAKRAAPTNNLQAHSRPTQASKFEDAGESCFKLLADAR